MKVRVRMYRAGLGDCLLLTSDPDAAAIHVMIDCRKQTAEQQGWAMPFAPLHQRLLE